MATTAEALTRFMRDIPLAKTMEYDVVELAPGAATMRAKHSAGLNGIFESFHGGLLMTLADTTACAAILTLTGTEQAMTTTDMNIRFLAACLSDATAKAKVIKFGKTLVPVQVDLFDAAGKHVAVAQVTYMRLPKIPAR